MRGIFTSLAFVLISVASADPLGTRPSPAAFETAPVGPGPVLQMLVALALVGAAIKWALPAAMKRFGGRISAPAGGTIRIEESAAFAGGRLYVVEVRGRTLLLGSTAQNVSCLADLTVPDFAEAMAGVVDVPASADESDPMTQLARLERLGL